MADLNSCNFTGRLTRDAEKKTLPTGTDLVTFDVANNTGWGDYKKTIFLTVNLWGKLGIGVLPYLKKGKQVALSGALEVQKWTSNQDGMEKQKNVLNCRDCILLSDSQGQGQSPQPQPSHKDDSPVDDYEDIPY
jgi:single-strand DNA-binding protein